MNKNYDELFSTSRLTKELSRKAVRGSSIMMGTEITLSILRIGSMVILARLLRPEDFGLLAMVTALTVFVERFKDLGLGDATVQKKEITHRQVSILFWINLGVGILISVVLASFAMEIGWFYGEPRLINVTLILASTFLFSGITIQLEAILRRQLRFGTLALINLISTIVSMIIAIALAYEGFGYWALLAREVSRAIFITFGTFFACPWRPSWPRKDEGLSSLLHFGKNVAGFNLAHFLSRSIDKILVGKLNGSYWLGLYTNAYQLLALPINQIQFPVNTVALPTLSALQGDPPQFKAYFNKILQLLIFLSTPIVVFTAIFGDVIIDLLLGPKWKGAVPIFRILAIGALVEPVVLVTGPAMLGFGKAKEYFRMGLLNSLLFVSSLIVGSHWGTMGIAMGYSAAIYFGLIVCLVYGLKMTPINSMATLRILITNCFYSIVTGLLLFVIRYETGWFFQQQFIVLFALMAALIYLALWMIFPRGRQLLQSYWKFAKDLFFGWYTKGYKIQAISEDE